MAPQVQHRPFLSIVDILLRRAGSATGKPQSNQASRGRICSIGRWCQWMVNECMTLRS